METELTKAIKAGLWKFTYRQGTFGCQEVTIGWFGSERVMFTGIFFEIKIMKQ